MDLTLKILLEIECSQKTKRKTCHAGGRKRKIIRRERDAYGKSRSWRRTGPRKVYKNTKKMQQESQGLLKECEVKIYRREENHQKNSLDKSKTDIKNTPRFTQIYPKRVARFTQSYPCLPISIRLGQVKVDLGRLECEYNVDSKKNGNCASNYSSIGLISVLGKILKTVRMDIIVIFLGNMLITDYQHGLRKKRSCLTNLIEVFSYI